MDALVACRPKEVYVENTGNIDVLRKLSVVVEVGVRVERMWE